MSDLSLDVFRAAMRRASERIATYLETIESRPVRPPIEPGTVAAALPDAPPIEAEALDVILDDYERLIEPNVTHWNHPGFLAYFSSTGSMPGILGETLAAGLSVNGMLWRTAPAAVELELRVCRWLRDMVGLPADFHGHINDTASISTMLSLAVARARAVPDAREAGLTGRNLPKLLVYTSEQAHSSVDKAAITLGLGLDQVRHVPTDDGFRMNPDALARMIAEDRAAGHQPIAVVATIGTTSTTSIDPVEAVADIADAEGLWFHVDAAWAGSAAVCADYRHLFAGWERADSVVINPHKWLFVPMDCSVLFVRDVDALRAAFALVPEYLTTAERATTVDLMDFGPQLGRRFRALKLWFVIRAFGVEGLAAVIREHIRLGQGIAARVDSDPDFERSAPTPFSTVCFRMIAPDLDASTLDRVNERLLDAVNADGRIFLSHTKLHDRYVLRFSVSNLRTEARHVDMAWELIREHATRLIGSSRQGAAIQSEEP